MWAHTRPEFNAIFPKFRWEKTLSVIKISLTLCTIAPLQNKAKNRLFRTSPYAIYRDYKHEIYSRQLVD